MHEQLTLLTIYQLQRVSADTLWRKMFHAFPARSMIFLPHFMSCPTYTPCANGASLPYTLPVLSQLPHGTRRNWNATHYMAFSLSPLAAASGEHGADLWQHTESAPVSCVFQAGKFPSERSAPADACSAPCPASLHASG